MARLKNVQNNFKKLLTLTCGSAKLVPHTVTSNNTNNTKMKKTLLIAAAALAAGVISTQAQPVYSQNIVGYANVVTPVAGNNYLLAVPFKIGVSNGANEVFGSSLPDFTQILIWSPTSSSYALYQTDSGSATGWDDNNFNPVPSPSLPVGQGFFLVPSSANITNTFVGNVAISPGTSNIMTFPSAGNNYLVGNVVPYAGSVTNGSNAGGGINLNGLADFTQVLIWNTAGSSFTLYQTDSGSATGWDDNNFNPVTPPSLAVGQGFFVVPSQANEQWIQGL